MNSPVRIPVILDRRLPGSPAQPLYRPMPAAIPVIQAHAQRGLAGPADQTPPDDVINAMYDIFGAYPRKNVLPYFYPFNLQTATGDALTALGTARPSIKVSADAAFICTEFTGASTGEYLMTIRTDSSDRILMNVSCHSATIVGTAERPFKLPKPLLLAPNTTVTFELTDLSNAANEVFFTMCGFKVYQSQFAAAG